MNKSDIKVGDILKHRSLGVVTVDESCILLNNLYGDPTSCFVVHGHSVVEVSVHLLDLVLRDGMNLVYLLYYEFKCGVDQDTILIGAFDSEDKVRLAQKEKEQNNASQYIIYFWESVEVK